MPREKYNARWPDELSDLGIELGCISYGGKWRSKETGRECGAGMIDHLFNARKLIWPDRYRHKWTDLLYNNFVENDITIMIGAASTQKTSHASEFVLLNYWARPQKTLAVLSTITVEKLDTGVYAELKMLWEMGRKRHPWLAGNLLEHKRQILTDNLETDGQRDTRKGIISRACYVGGKWVGLGVLAGTKQEYMFYLCDEIQFMAETFTASWPNMFSNGNVKIIGSGNPKHDVDDQLGVAAEPKEGWSGMPVPDKTAVWETQFMGGKCVNLVGTDSANFDVPEGQPEPFPKLIGRKFVKRIANDWGENSPEYFTQCVGVMRIDQSDKRVITRQLCREHQAHEIAIWSPARLTKVAGLDPSYGGGDQCIATFLEFGLDENSKELLAVTEQIDYRLDLTLNIPVEDQIAIRFKADLQKRGIPPSNGFYDPYGKGTMGYAFARVFGADSPIPVDSGGQPTERPVRAGLYVEETDGKRHLKTCREHFSKFVTEAWFMVRYIIEANQLRRLPVDCMIEGCGRKYDTVGGNKIEVESKDDYKLRMKRSPNKFDSLAIAVEGARQRGFGVDKLGAAVITSREDDEKFFKEETEQWEQLLQGSLLNHGDKKRELSLSL